MAISLFTGSSVKFGVPKPTLKFGYVPHIDKSDQKSVVEQLANATKYSVIQPLDGAIYLYPVKFQNIVLHSRIPVTV